MEIITDNRWKQLRYRYEVPAKVLRDQFEHLPEDDVLDGFFCYRKRWYHTSDFMCPATVFAGWDGYHSDSYFSGVLLSLSRDGEEYKAARYYS